MTTAIQRHLAAVQSGQAQEAMTAARLVEILAQHMATHPLGASAPVYICGPEPRAVVRCYDLGDGRPLYIGGES
jgi:hypothetical protein